MNRTSISWTLGLELKFGLYLLLCDTSRGEIDYFSNICVFLDEQITFETDFPCLIIDSHNYH